MHCSQLFSLECVLVANIAPATAEAAFVAHVEIYFSKFSEERVWIQSMTLRWYTELRFVNLSSDAW